MTTIMIFRQCIELICMKIDLNRPEYLMIRDCICVSVIMEHIPIRALVDIICEYSAEYSAERISYWLANNGDCSQFRFGISYRSDRRTIVLRTFAVPPSYVMCSPGKVIEYLTGGALIPYIRHLGMSEVDTNKAITFMHSTGSRLSQNVRPKCHYIDQYA